MSINFNNKACRPVPTMRIYTVNRNRVDLCLQGSGDLRMCGSQTGPEYRSNSVFLDDLLMFYQAFGVNLMRFVNCFLRKGGARLLGHALLLGHIR